MAISQLFYDIITVDVILGFDVLRNFVITLNGIVVGRVLLEIRMSDVY